MKKSPETRIMVCDFLPVTTGPDTLSVSLSSANQSIHGIRGTENLRLRLTKRRREIYFNSVEKEKGQEQKTEPLFWPIEEKQN